MLVGVGGSGVVEKLRSCRFNQRERERFVLFNFNYIKKKFKFSSICSVL